jgi:hypothetical protein
MKSFSLFFIGMIYMNLGHASCEQLFRKKAWEIKDRHEAIGLGVFTGSSMLIPMVGPFALIPMGAGAVWILQAAVVPSSPSKVAQLILDAQLLVSSPEVAKKILATEPRALKRLDIIVKRVTGLKMKDQQYQHARRDIAKIIVEGNAGQDFCTGGELIKFKDVDDYVIGRL